MRVKKYFKSYSLSAVHKWESQQKIISFLVLTILLLLPMFNNRDRVDAADGKYVTLYNIE